MFNKLLLLLNGIAMSALSFSQEINSPVLLASCGNFFKIDNSYSLSYTIGEMSINTFSKGDYILTEGFQQGKPHNPPLPFMDILCMPNPVEDYLKVSFYVNEGLSFVIHIFNVTGMAISNYEIDNVSNKAPYLLDFRRFAKGLFFVKILSKDGKIQRTFKIEKI